MVSSVRKIKAGLNRLYTLKTKPNWNTLSVRPAVPEQQFENHPPRITFSLKTVTF